MVSRMRCVLSRARPAILAVVLLAAPLSPPAVAAEIRVILDQAKLVGLPEGVSTIIVGNPLIADVAVQGTGVMVVTGKGYGTTNVIALDRNGKVLLERDVEVEGPSQNVVIVYRGLDRESYSCTPNCERRIMLGDSATFFTTTITQAGTRNTQALGSAGGNR